MENKQILIGALAAISAAAVVYYLSADSSATTVKFDPKVHTEERMMQLMEELKLEYTCIYVRHYNLIKRMQEQNTFKPEHLHDLKAQVEQEKNDKFKQVVANYEKFTPEIVNAWVS